VAYRNGKGRGKKEGAGRNGRNVTGAAEGTELGWELNVSGIAVGAGSSIIEYEVASQPECWRLAREVAGKGILPAAGQRVAIMGCGTSWYVSQAVAAWREASEHGTSDAFPASEMPPGRKYDVVVAISRSGTTTEVLRAVSKVGSDCEIVAITTSTMNPLAARTKTTVTLGFGDEEAEVQTRFATSVMALWRAHLGHDMEELVRLGKERLEAPLPANLETYRQFVFLGQGPGVGVAGEAALKMREATQSWSEAYPAMEFRHGSISVIGAHTLVWALGQLPPGLGDEIRATGSGLVTWDGDPMVDLVRVHRAAIALAKLKGLDPAHPRGVTRSIVLE